MVMTCPIIGNTGFTRNAPAGLYNERFTGPSGVIVKDYSERPNHWRCDMTISEYMTENNIFGLSYVDTRMLTRKICKNSSFNWCSQHLKWLKIKFYKNLFSGSQVVPCG
jgi:carbamoyl-phosphate synthase small subunit